MTNIYGLIDPRTNEIRYVGKADNVEGRLYQHLAPSNLSGKTHKENWLKSLLREGLRPRLVILEVVDDAVWAEKEKYWIEVCKVSGCDLTNSTEGGEGAQDLEEFKKKMSDLKKGHPAYPTQQKAAVESNKKRKVSPKVLEAFKKNWEKGRKEKQETTEKKRIAATGRKHSEESKRKISEAKIKWHAEKRKLRLIS